MLIFSATTLEEKERTGRPTVEELIEEVSGLPADSYSSVVLAGEGEPTLRMASLEALVTQLQQRNGSKNNNIKHRIRVTTNGLGSSTTGSDIPQRLAQCGVDSVSVALPTSDPLQYKALMQPCEPYGHECVLAFLQSSLEVGLEVEVTAIDRDDVNKASLETLIQRLGIPSPVRWRPYFP